MFCISRGGTEEYVLHVIHPPCILLSPWISVHHSNLRAYGALYFELHSIFNVGNMNLSRIGGSCPTTNGEEQYFYSHDSDYDLPSFFMPTSYAPYSLPLPPQPFSPGVSRKL